MMEAGMRESFGEALVNLGRKNEKLLVLDADVSSSTKTGVFASEFPERFYNMGVAEANMTGVAAGMAACGYIPVVSAFAIFIALKATDQIRNDICYNHLPVILAGGYAGLSDSFDGASHQSLTDIAIMRAMPGMTVLVPADAHQIQPALEQAVAMEGPVYLRLYRNPVPVIEDLPPLKIGTAPIVREGSHITIGSCGVILSMVLEAAERLERENISVEVLDLSSVKPLDEEAVISSVRKTGCFLSVEEHSVMGGAGGAVAEVLSARHPVPMARIGIEDTFTESGPYEALLQKYGISIESICNKARKLIEYKVTG